MILDGGIFVAKHLSILAEEFKRILIWNYYKHMKQ